jgi:hypothetical protein
MTKPKTNRAPNLKELSEGQRHFYREAVRLYRKRVHWFDFWNFAFGMGSPLYEGSRSLSNVLDTPLEKALRSMWLDLGVQQGMVKPEEPKRAARRK